MSNKFATYKIYAQLAGASYKDALKDENGNEIKDDNGNIKYNIMPPQGYKELNSKDYLGFQATLYQDTKTGEKILAIRGTDAEVSFNGLDDINNDILLTLFGGNAQLNDLERYYEELINNGFLNPNDKITVTGHSLGGFLTQYFSVVHNDIVDNAYTFNAPGLGSFVENITNKFGNIIVPSDLKNINNVTNIVAKDGINLIHSLGSHIGKTVKISGNTHSIKDLTEILYFYDEMINKGATEDNVTEFLSGYYNSPNMILNGSVANIANKTINQIADLVKVSGGDTIDTCLNLEKDSYKIELLDKNKASSKSFNKNNIAELYAITHLNLFIIKGINPQEYIDLEQYKDEYSDGYMRDKKAMLKEILKNSKSTDSYYDDLESGITLKGNYSNTIMMKIYAKNQYRFGTNEDNIINGNDEISTWVYMSSDGQTNIYSLAGNDTITGAKGNNYIEAGSGSDYVNLTSSTKGTKNTVYGDIKDSKEEKPNLTYNDTIIGGDGDDTIYGSIGDDIIQGNSTNSDNKDETNYLYGGKGSDTVVGSNGIDYIYASGNDDTDDTIDINILVGRDGDDKIFGDKGINYIYAGAGSDTISANGANKNIIFTHRDYDINTKTILLDDEDKESETNTVTITGDSSNHIYGGVGNDTVTITGNGDNTINLGDGTNSVSIDGNGENSITTGKESDTIAVSGNGKTNINSGDGDDTITVTGSGETTVNGGGGNDTITTGDGDDTIYANHNLADNKDDDSDTIKGGAGYDKYYVGNGDTIEDSDHRGSVWFKNRYPLSGGIEIKPNSQIYKGDGYTYTLNGSTLIVTHDDTNESITIENFNQEKNSLGIALKNKIAFRVADVTVNESDASTQATIEMIGTIVGDDSYKVKLRSNDEYVVFKKGTTSQQVTLKDIKDTYDDFIVNDHDRKIGLNPWHIAPNKKGGNTNTVYDSTISKYGNLTVNDDDTPFTLVLEGSRGASESDETIFGSLSAIGNWKPGMFIEVKLDGKIYRLDINTQSHDNVKVSSWKDDEIVEEDSKFYVRASVWSSNVTAYESKEILLKIFDDDKDKDNDPENESSPIVIDLNKNKITSTKLNNAVYFDHDNNGFKEATGWIESGDAFLALDKNKNGIIDSGNELFGNHTITNSNYKFTNPNSTNGFEALKSYDENSDGIINMRDSIFNDLVLWQDKNSNGITDEGELIKLKDSQILSIDLKYKQANIDEKGNTIKQTSTVVFEDGSTTTANDVWFRVNPDKTQETKTSISNEIKTLPNVDGFGNINSLHVAMSKNAKLETMVKSYIAMNEEERLNIIDEIIYEWAGVSSLDKEAMRGGVNLKDMIVYEKFTGKPFLQQGTDPNPRPNASAMIRNRVQIFKNYVYANLELQTTYKDLNIDTEFMYQDVDGVIAYKFDKLNDALSFYYKNNDLKSISKLLTTIRTATYYKPNYNKELKNNLTLLFKDDLKTLNIALGTYVGGVNNKDEILIGNSDDNFIDSKSGDDILKGGGGDDTYKFDKGYGKDIIYDTEGKNKLLFSKKISSDKIVFKRELGNLIIQILDDDGALTSDSVTIQNFFDINSDFGNGALNSIEFEDGKVVSIGDFLHMAIEATNMDDKLYLTSGNDKFNANSGDDIIYGGKGHDTIYGDDGNDTLYGDNGDDTLIGGIGNDTLHGGMGSDTYIFGKNFGNDTIINYNSDSSKDTIKFIDGITKDDIIFKKEAKNLILTLKNHSTSNQKDSITVIDFFSKTNSKFYNSITHIEFSNKEVLTLKDITNILATFSDDNSNYIEALTDDSYTIDAKGGDDVIITGSGNDTLIGGSGNDTLQGGDGNDTLINLEITLEKM